MKTRKTAFAGKFYPDDKQDIEELLYLAVRKEGKDINYKLAENKIIGGISPHAGYIYSAYEAVHLLEIIKKSEQVFDTVVLVTPSHTGFGHEISFDDNDVWETPLGNVDIDKAFYPLTDIPESGDAHKYEHSGEVIVPMLQYFFQFDFKLLPICLREQNLDNAKKIASQIYEANKTLQKRILFIASSDFTHFMSPEEGAKMDNYVVDGILKLNSNDICREVESKNISVCGYGPIASLIEYTKLVCDEPDVELLRRGHSGEVMVSDSVVDYISFLFSDPK